MIEILKWDMRMIWKMIEYRVDDVSTVGCIETRKVLNENYRYVSIRKLFCGIINGRTMDLWN